MNYLDDPELATEIPIQVKPKNKTKNYNKDKHTFVPDAVNKNKKIIKEFYGCYFHGCPKCYPEHRKKYDKTKEREKLLVNEGFSIETMWECEWKELKETLSNKLEIEEMAKNQNIKTRDALHGGRTEAFKTYSICSTSNQQIYYFDVVSLYPTVNALDDYAVGFKKYVNITVDDIKKNNFIGLVKCDVQPPEDLYIPVLPEINDGKLLFHLNPIKEKTYTTAELRLALQKGYKITKIYSATEYKRFNGLMEKYVANFVQMKIANSGKNPKRVRRNKYIS